MPLIWPVSNRDLLKSYLQNPSSLNSEVSQSQQHTGTTASLTKDIDKPLDRSDYPQILFWFKQDWLHYERENSGATRLLSRGKGRAGENISLRYIEGKDGNVIDGYRAGEIRKFARSIWMQLANYTVQGPGRARANPFFLALDPGPQGRATLSWPVGSGQGRARAGPDPMKICLNV